MAIDMVEITEIKLTSKKPASFYTRAVTSFLRGTGTKEPEDELLITATGNAIGNAVAVTERIEKTQTGKVVQICTDYLRMGDAMSPQIRVKIQRIPPIVIMLDVDIKEDCIEDFLQAMHANVAGSRLEPGCLRFDLLRDQANPLRFVTYEVFASQEAFDKHKGMLHLKAWGALQYGPRQPCTRKSVVRADGIIFRGLSPAATGTPLAVLRDVEIQSEHVDEFVAVQSANAKGSYAESGCLRFDMLRSQDSPCKFVAYEVYNSTEALEAHQEMPHCKPWEVLQSGDKKPVVNMTVSKLTPVEFQAPELLS